jgi:ppGpp synthetase/RelA/SpoT-type nucleotidyltranferase
MQGYRAVHVIAYPDGYPIEIQIRTEWQHLWAEWFERLADRYGRGIRYGEPPAHGGESAQGMIDSMVQMADQIAESEATDTMPPPAAVVAALIESVLKWLRERDQGTNP